MGNRRHWLRFIHVVFFTARPKLLENLDFSLELMLMNVTVYPPHLYPNVPISSQQYVSKMSPSSLSCSLLSCSWNARASQDKAELVLMLLATILNREFLMYVSAQTGPKQANGMINSHGDYLYFGRDPTWVPDHLPALDAIPRSMPLPTCSASPEGP